MNVFVHYDRSGAIRGFVTVEAPEGAGMMLASKPGILVAELEGVQVQSGPGAAAELRELAKRNIVKAPQQRATLVKKS